MSDTEGLYTLFLETFLILDDNERHFFSKYDLSSARYHALWHVQRKPGLSLRELSDLLICTKGNTTRIVKILEARSYLTRQVDAQDNRVLCLYLTEKGQQLLEVVSEAYRAFKHACYGHLSPGEQITLQQDLHSLKDHLRDQLQTL